MSTLVSTPRTKTQVPSLSDTLKRKLQVYVEIPPSPLHTSSSGATFGKFTTLPNHKSGTPLTSKVLNFNATDIVMESPLKKQKLAVATVATKPIQAKAPAPIVVNGLKVTEKFPNGYFLCHHCHRQRDATLLFRCTLKKTKTCGRKYCMTCVLRHYGQDSNTIKPRGVGADSEDQTVHDTEAGHTWKCPKCAGCCKCSSCKKPKLSKSGVPTEPIYVSLSGGAFQVVPSPSRMRPIVEVPTITASSRFGVIKPSGPVTRVGKPRKKVQVPELKWVEVETSLSLSEAEDRFFIREFILRFSCLMDISQLHLESLDEFDHLTDAAAKSFIVNLLSLIAADTNPGDQKTIQATIKKLSSAGFNPSSIWAVLSGLRDKVSNSVLTFPDPAEIVARSVRLRTTNAVSSAKQLLPIIQSLIEFAIKGESVREEIENGSKDIKEKTKEYWSVAREENDRWTEERQKLTGEKTEGEKKDGWDAAKWLKMHRLASQKHKAKLLELEKAHYLEVQTFVPRFAPLGIDAEGRIFYISTSFKGKKIPSANERKAMRKWSWFLAVWDKNATRQPNKGLLVNEDGEEDELDGDDDDRGCWYGFADPADIRALTKWIANKEGLNEKILQDEKNIDVEREGQRSSYTLGGVDIPAKDVEMEWRPSKAGLKSLVKGLNDYADFLEWRCGEQKDKATDADGDKADASTSEKGKGKAK